MPASKLKNIILAILLLTNLFLLALVVPARRAAGERAQAMHDSLQALFSEYGVTLECALPTDEQPLSPLTLEANVRAQEAAAAALLGKDAAADAGSGSYRSVYRSDAGSCQFVHGGSFSAALTGEERSSDDPARAADRLLGRMGFDTDGAEAPVRLSAGVFSVTAAQRISGRLVFSARLTLTYANGSLTELEGTFLTGTPSAVQDAQTGLACADALIAFLGSRDSLGWVGSRVTRVRQGYVQAETASATTVRLAPVWRIETDAGAFDVDGQTGAVTAAE